MRFFLYLFFLLSLSLFFLACAPKSYKLFESMEALEFSDEKADERIEKLKAQVVAEEGKTEKIIQSSLNRARFYRMLALQYFGLELYGEAYRYFDEALKLTPRNALLLEYRGAAAMQYAWSLASIEEKDHFWQIAENSYKAALELDPQRMDSLYGLAVLSAHVRGRIDEALLTLNRLIDLEGKHRDGWFLKGKLHALKKDIPAARFSLQRALDLSQDLSSREEIKTVLDRLP